MTLEERVAQLESDLEDYETYRVASTHTLSIFAQLVENAMSNGNVFTREALAGSIRDTIRGARREPNTLIFEVMLGHMEEIASILEEPWKDVMGLYVIEGGKK